MTTHEPPRAGEPDRRSAGSGAASAEETWARTFFDGWSESATFQRLRPWLQYVQTRVMEQIDWSRARRFLDVACGSGWAVVEAARRLGATGGGLACGCDISFGMLEQRSGEGAGGARARFLAASAQVLPYADASFDAVICTAAFHHFPDPLAALGELRRVLRPKGIAVVAETCRDLSLGTWIWDRVLRRIEDGHIEYYRSSDLIALFENAGFRDVTFTEVRPSFSATRKLVRKAALFRGTAP